MYRVKEVLTEFDYYCVCLKVNGVENIHKKCVTLIDGKRNFKHYVVIEKVAGGYVYFYDPLFLFVRKKKIEDFYKSWSKICLFYTKV